MTDHTNTSDHDLHWPNAGDRLLLQTTWEEGARFADHPRARDGRIWSGYMRAGAVLIAECEQDSAAKHELIYPILFSYRHALEAAMKWILNGYGGYADASEYKRNHNLLELWSLCRATFASLNADGDDAIAVVGEIVTEFAALDQKSFAFRYSTEKDGSTVALPEGSIDLENLREVMAGVEGFFIGVDGYLDAQTWLVSDAYHHALDFMAAS